MNTKNYQGKEFCENVGIVMFFIFFTIYLIILYICTKVHENIFHGSQVTEGIVFSNGKLQRGII